MSEMKGSCIVAKFSCCSLPYEFFYLLPHESSCPTSRSKQRRPCLPFLHPGGEYRLGIRWVHIHLVWTVVFTKVRAFRDFLISSCQESLAVALKDCLGPYTENNLPASFRNGPLFFSDLLSIFNTLFLSTKFL